MVVRKCTLEYNGVQSTVTSSHYKSYMDIVKTESSLNEVQTNFVTTASYGSIQLSKYIQVDRSLAQSRPKTVAFVSWNMSKSAVCPTRLSLCPPPYNELIKTVWTKLEALVSRHEPSLSKRLVLLHAGV